jgi:hypothetical protein
LVTAACVRRLSGSPYLGEQEWVTEALERQADAPPAAAEALPVAVALREVRLRCTEVMGGMYWQASIDYQEEPETDPGRVAWGTASAVIVAVGRQAQIAAGLPDGRPEDEHRWAGERAVCDLVRCVFANPFRPARLAPSWRTSDVLSLARGVYEERAFDRLPILADALLDAGCEDRELLDHCCGPCPHARGCWVVDSVLGLAEAQRSPQDRSEVVTRMGAGGLVGRRGPAHRPCWRLRGCIRGEAIGE